MKKCLLFYMLTLVAFSTFGQSNTFPASGRVGIGTTSPISLLDIVGSSPELYLRNSYSAMSVIRILPFTDGATYFQTGSSTVADSRADLKFTSISGVTNFMIIKGSTGNIGIGTTVPQSRLAVNGTVTAKQVKVTQTGWPDYIFDSTYRLPDLLKTEHFIKANRRLPQMPSAEEIEDKGLDLGDMQKKQMQKIEELTLYIIQLNQRIEIQDRKINELTRTLNQPKRK